MEQNESLDENKIEVAEADKENEAEMTEAVEEVEKEENKSSKSKKAILISIVVVALIVSAAFYYVKRSSDMSSNPGNGVVATVNGENITKSEYDTLYQQLLPQIQQSGLLDNAEYIKSVKAQIVDGLVNDKLLLQHAKTSGITATQEDIDNYLASLAQQLGGEDKLNAQMTQEGITKEKLISDITKQVIIRKYLLANIDLASFSASDDEIQSFYDNAVNGQEGAPALADVRSQVSDQIIQGKQQKAISDFISTLRAVSDIKINL